MKLKLDENIGNRGLELLRAPGHDVTTVGEQGLRGISDDKLFEICGSERRALITLDRDFGQIPRFPPERSAGIAILQVGPRATLSGILDAVANLLAMLESRSIVAELWIIEPGRVRIHIGNDEDD